MSKCRCEWGASAATGATYQVYEIRTVSDFLKVPEDRRRICLREFDAWLHMREGIPALIHAASEALGVPLPPNAIQLLNPDVFQWHDDGKATLSVTMEAQDAAPQP